jgi:hypothetical protein
MSVTPRRREVKLFGNPRQSPLHFRLRHGAFKSMLAESLCLAAASACRHVLAIAISDRRW